MTTNNRPHNPLAATLAVFWVVMLLAFGIGSFFGEVSPSYAQTDTTPTTGTTTPASTTATNTTSISNTTTIITATTPVNSTNGATAGGTINVFCLNFQKTFPTGQTIKAQGLANAQVRGVLAYALNKGYITTQPYQVQLAIYALQDNLPFHDFRNEGTQIAQEIMANAGAVPSTGDGNVLSSLTITNIKPASADQFYGSGEIQGSTIPQNLPVGFLLPASAANFQNLVAVVVPATPVSSATPGQAVPTPAPVITTAPFPTAVPQPTPAQTVLGVSSLPATGAGGSSEPDNGGWLFSLGLVMVVISLGFGFTYYGLGRKRL